MRRSVVVAALVVAACEGRPERPDPADFPDAIEETGLGLLVNDCKTRSYEFNVESRGFVTTTFSGVGTFVYEPELQRSTIQLSGCGPDRAKAIALPFYGVGRVPRGPFEVKRLAPEEGGFLFTFVDNTDGADVVCDDRPEGTVTITRSNQTIVGGRFDVTARCTDSTLLDDGDVLVPTRFRGHFRALDVGDPLDEDL